MDIITSRFKISHTSKITFILIIRHFNIIEEKLPPKWGLSENNQTVNFFLEIGNFKVVT